MRGGRKLVSAQADASEASVKPRSGGRSYEGRSRYYEAEEADEAVAAYRANPSGRGLPGRWLCHRFVLLRAIISGKQPGAPAREYFRGSLTPALGSLVSGPRRYLPVTIGCCLINSTSWCSRAREGRRLLFQFHRDSRLQ